MSKRHKRGRPTDPAEIARRRAIEEARRAETDRDPAQWGLAAGLLDLPSNAAVEITRESAGRVVRARRQDVFDLLRGRGKLSVAGFDAVRRLQNDMAVLHRTAAGGGDYAPKVDRSRAADTFVEARQRAGARIDAVLGLAGPVSARLIACICEADAALGRQSDWRALVARETGETLADAQGAILRAACENLAGAYGLIDRSRGRPAAPAASA